MSAGPEFEGAVGGALAPTGVAEANRQQWAAVATKEGTKPFGEGCAAA